MIKIKTGLYLIAVFFLTIPILLNCNMNSNDLTITSPNQKIAVNISVYENNALRFGIYLGEKQILQQSKLGIIRQDADFVNGLKILSVSKSERIVDKYSMLLGKKKDCSYLANQRVYHLENKAGEKMDIIFRVSDDGVAFRYYFPGNSEDVKTISQEMTSYVFTKGTKAWIQPIADPKTGWMRSNPSYEEDYEQEVEVRALRKNGSGWVYPALFNSAGVWMCITETAPYRDYCGTRLMHEDGSLEFTVGFPSQKETLNEKEGANPNSNLTWSSPWRIIAIGEDLDAIVESTLGTDLAKPSVLKDISYVKPGRA